MVGSSTPEPTIARVRRSAWAVAAIAVAALSACTGSGSTSPSTASPPPSTASPPTSQATTGAEGPTASSPLPASTSPSPSPSPSPRATAPPAWLGTRRLQPGPTGFPPPQPTPDELFPRAITTDGVLPPPADVAFASTVRPVDEAVAERSTWHAGCPVGLDDLRHVTVTHVGFDGADHTGELLVHADAADAVVAMFEAMHRERFPLERVAITTPADLAAPATGDGNTTSVFVCRESRGSAAWSEHAFGRALDINPFHNPYDRHTSDGRVVLPELATAYTDRTLDLPGMLTADSTVVAVARAHGWQWGGDYTSVSDPMHLSATGR